MSERSAVIVGAGLAGALMACYLAKAGWRVRVYERRPDPRRAGYGGGRSINLALSARGFWGLAGVGLDTVVRERDAIPMPGRMIHPAGGGAPIFQPYSARSGDAINSVSRGGLNLTLIEAAAAMPGVELVFDHLCVDVDLGPPRAAAVFAGPAGPIRIEADLVIGADGAFSAVRGVMQKTDRYEYSQSYLGHGYKELHIPAGPNGGFAMEPGALHIWPRGGAMMIALPNRDGSFTCTLFWPFEGEHSFAGLAGGDPECVSAFFREHYPDAVPLTPTLAEDFVRNPTSSLVTVRCWPWQFGGKVVLIGDAAHAIVPFYGQGINCGFEDCRVLAECLTRATGQREALEEYQGLRKPNADAIAEMAIENFVEMRDKTGQAAFRYKKKVERAVHGAFGERAEPQYNLVSFSTVPYTEARRRGRALDAVLARVVEAVPESVLAEVGEEEWRRRVVAAAGESLADAEAESSQPRIGRHDRSPGVDGSEASSKTAQPRRPVEVVIDISPPITARLGVWPGDTALTRDVLLDIERGGNITLSTIRATVHLGAHADGPNHYGTGAPGIGERPLHYYIGPCRVVEARVARGGRVRPEDVVGGLDQIREPRVLIRTGTFPDPEHWNADFAALSVELIDALASRGVITIGIDTPSVDVQDSKDLPAHQAMLRHDMAILEGIVLADVPPGAYELIALPLKLMGFDASPLRAVLRPVGA